MIPEEERQPTHSVILVLLSIYLWSFLFLANLLTFASGWIGSRPGPRPALVLGFAAASDIRWLDRSSINAAAGAGTAAVVCNESENLWQVDRWSLFRSLAQETGEKEKRMEIQPWGNLLRRKIEEFLRSFVRRLFHTWFPASASAAAGGGFWWSWVSCFRT